MSTVDEDKFKKKESHPKASKSDMNQRWPDHEYMNDKNLLKKGKIKWILATRVDPIGSGSTSSFLKC
jgi:hypothetical protein